MQATLKTFCTLTASHMYDLIQIGRGIFPPDLALTPEQQRRVKRWSDRLFEMSNGYIDPDPIVAAKSMRLAEFLSSRNAVDLCELVQCSTGTKYPA